MEHKLYGLWVELLEYCQSSEFDQKMFEVKSKNFASWYKKADCKTQGAFHFYVSMHR